MESPLPAAVVTQIMRSSFHPEKDDNCNLNGSKPAAWNKVSNDDLYRQAGELTGLRNGEPLADHDMVSVQEAKQLQRKSGKGCRSNGNGSRRSRAAHMEGSLNVTAAVDVNDLPKYNGVDKTQMGKPKTVVSGKRNGKISKSKCDSFSVKAGLSSFSSAAGGNNILGVYGSKHDIREFAKHVKEVSLKELLDGSYKCPDSIKVKEKSTEALNGSILQSVREACSVLHLHRLTQTPKVPAASFNYLTKSSTNDDSNGDAVESACNKAENSCAGPTDNCANILQFPLFEPKDILDRLTLPPHKDLDVMLLDSMKPTSSLKVPTINFTPNVSSIFDHYKIEGDEVEVHNGGSLPMFPWSHVSVGHFKANPDVVKSTLSKNTCQSRWAKMGKSTTSLRDTNATTYLADFQSLTYNQNLVPLPSQPPRSIEKSTPFGTRTTAPKGEHSPGILSAAQTLCNIAAEFRKRGQYGLTSWHRKFSQKSIRASKLTSDEKLEKALFTIPSSRPPVGSTSGPDGAKSHTSKKLKQPVNNPTKGQYHWSTFTPQSSRSSSLLSSPSKLFKNMSSPVEAKHQESSGSLLKRSMTAPPAKSPNKPSKLRKLTPFEWKRRGDEKGHAK